MRDVRYAFRTLARNPGFTLAALVALALGIGANTAVFSVINGVLLRPLPYPGSERLVVIFDSFDQQGMEIGPACMADFLDWKARSRSFETLDAIATNRVTITGDGEAEQIVSMSVTANFFNTLGARPLLGRTFAAGEDQPGRTQTVVLSERLWRRRYGSDPAVLGKSTALNSRPHTIIGVMPAGSQFGQRDTDAWAILTLNPPTRRGPFFLRGMARLKPDVTLEQANADMQAIARDVERANPKDYRRLRYPVVLLRETIVGDVRPLLWVLSGVVFLVLLIAVSNVANLMLSRAAARRREIAIRLSMGATRAHLVRLSITESLVLSLSSSLVGVGLASGGVGALRWLAPPGLPRLNEISVDARVLAFTLLVSVASALILGLVPALGVSTATLGESLKEGSRGSTVARGHRRVLGSLVIAQVTLSVMLLVGAGLMIRSFSLLGRVDPGFQAAPEHVLTMLVSPTGARYRDAGNRGLAAYWEQLLDRVRTLPGIAAASIAISIPPDRLAFTDGFEIENRPEPSGSDYPAVPVPIVSQDYFKTLGIPLLRGRWFDHRDTAESPRVTVISETMARRHFSGEDPIGKRLKHGGRALTNPYMEIIGVVGDVKYQGLGGEDEPVYYEVTSQSPARPMWLLLRTHGDAQALVSAVRKEIRELDPDVPVARISTMTEALSDSVSLPRFRALLMAIFAATALMLAAIGIYGVIAYSVTQRTQEIGVRMALGATAASVLRLVVVQGSRLALVGISLGLAGAFGLSRVLKKMLFGVTTTDPLTFASVVLILGAVAVLASLIPAFRAARLDPVTALRRE
jgi:putative ABC transport system permease protein